MDNMAITLGKRNLVDSIWKSANIEGLGTTFPSTEAILENLPAYTKRDEVYFVCNMKRAWEFLFDNMDYPINLAFIREINKVSMEHLGYGVGVERNIPVTIGGTKWQPDMPNTACIIEDLRKIQENPDKEDMALEMFAYLTRKQIFIDGNKRLAQLVANRILMENDIGIMAIPVEKKSEFTEVLINFYETGDNNRLKEFLHRECMQYAYPKEKEEEGEIERE